jgi:farnesyl diphosphate synthase
MAAATQTSSRLTDGPVSSLADFSAWMLDRQQHVESLAHAALPAPNDQPVDLHRAMRYAVLDGGKRIRPLLAYATGECSGADPAVLDAIALGLEYIHAYSLVHDDLPCMDDDVLRRGKPTVHVAFGEATAMLAGDALQTEAFRVVALAPAPPQMVVALVRCLAEASGAGGMCGGQAIDLASENQSLSEACLEDMHGKKTGALLKAAVMMAARAGQLDQAQVSCLDRFAAAVGLAFQVVDDILDVEATSAELGKTVGKDQQQNKSTYVTVMGLARAKERAAQLLTVALSALHDTGLPASRHARLQHLARLVVERRH